VSTFRQGRFERVLEPGVHWLGAPFGGLKVEVYDLTVPEFEHPRVEFLVQEARAVVERYFQVVELGDREAGVVYKQGRVAGVLAPGRRQLYWRAPVEVTVEKYDLTESFELPKARRQVGRLAGASGAEFRSRLGSYSTGSRNPAGSVCAV
jgi:hypothetical protein